MYKEISTLNLLAMADAYAAATGLSSATVSRRFHGNQAFLEDFRRGDCSVTVSKLDEMIAELRAAWPKGAAMPRLPAVPFKGKKLDKVVDKSDAA